MESSIGAQLKQIRESQGISLETIAHKTHISLDYLKALETDDAELLPSKVHLRGFLRLYASELGVELDDLTVGDYHLAEIQSIPKSTDELEEVFEDQTGISEEPAESTPPDELNEGEPGSEPKIISAQEPEPTPLPLISEPEPGSASSELKESAGIFKAIGEKINARRESLSLSINEIHNNLHIPPQYLAAIEAGRFDQLPSPVQAKGMLINYAEFLNLDIDSLLSDFTDALQLQRIEKQATQPKRGRRSATQLTPAALRLKNFFTLDLLVITVLLLAFAAFLIWGANRILNSDPQQTGDSNIPGVSDVLLASDTPTPELPSEIEPTILDEQQDQALETETTGEEEALLFTPVVSTDPINIILVPRQRLWVEVTVDGNLEFQGRLLPGNAYDYAGEEQIDLLTGNIGALQILFNNEDIGSQGVLGQVADLSFTVDGLVLPPPTSTPTITATPPATPTPTTTENNDQTN